MKRGEPTHDMVVVRVPVLCLPADEPELCCCLIVAETEERDDLERVVPFCEIERERSDVDSGGRGHDRLTDGDRVHDPLCRLLETSLVEIVMNRVGRVVDRLPGQRLQTAGHSMEHKD